MADPAVNGLLTKTLCGRGGRLGLPELQQLVGLSPQQLEETLAAAGPQRFLVVRSGGGGAPPSVLAVSGVRVCSRKECGGCERLHLCKGHLLGKCGLGSRSCKYSHDIISAENKKVLKSHELSCLDENDLRVLLLQNDPFFFPDVCQFYNRKDDACIQQNKCNKLHICRHFLHGECRFLPCKRSHNLLDAHALALLQSAGIDWRVASNIQAIFDHRHADFIQELKKEKMHQKPRENALKKPADRRSKELKVPLQPAGSTLRTPPSEGPGSSVPDQSQHRLPTGAGGKDKDKKEDSSTKSLKDNKEGNCDEICVFHVWKYCKHKDKCKFVHYHLPYRWQVYNGITWNDLSTMEEVEKAYCDPKNSSIPDKNINFKTMTCSSSSLRRLSTPSSVTKPGFVLTTEWIWYWKNDQGQWIEYGEQGEKNSTNAPSSAIIENLYLADPGTTISFQAGLHHYQLDFKEMIQTNILYKTRREVCRRPKFVSFEDMQKIKKGQKDSSIPSKTCPTHWDPSALPELGYKKLGRDQTFNVETVKKPSNNTTWWVLVDWRSRKGNLYVLFKSPSTVTYITDPNTDRGLKDIKEHLNEIGRKSSLLKKSSSTVELSNTTSEYNKIKQLFHQTMNGYSILKIRRIQNPSLWKVFQWQKEQMKRENGGKEVNEKLLFHGTKTAFVEAICVHNFDWRICGSNGTNYGKGSYFARDASYSHAYCTQPAVRTNTMFVARVLVGDYVRGNATYVRPPAKSVDGLRFYDSCVDNEFNPSIFVVFEKYQIYPEYMIDYKEEEKCIIC